MVPVIPPRLPRGIGFDLMLAGFAPDDQALTAAGALGVIGTHDRASHLLCFIEELCEKANESYKLQCPFGIVFDDLVSTWVS